MIILYNKTVENIKKKTVLENLQWPCVNYQLIAILHGEVKEQPIPGCFGELFPQYILILLADDAEL